MGQLTADDVLSTLTVCCGEEPTGPAEAVALVRQSQPTLASILYSTWQVEGLVLDAGLDHELAIAEAKMARFRELSSELTATYPGLLSLKGLEVADLYPVGITRSMNDLDLVANSQTQLWQASAQLLRQGWQLHTATFSRFGGKLQVLVSLRLPFESEYVLPYGIEIATYVTLGDLGGVPPLEQLPPHWRASSVKNLLMLLFERFEQRYRARDLIDAALLLRRTTPAALAALESAIAQLHLAPEYAELAGLVGATTLGRLPLAAPSPSVVRADRARRAARRLGQLRRPRSAAARHLQRRNITARLSRPERPLWQALQDQVSVPAALRAGMLAFGLPLDSPPPTVVEAILRTSPGLSWVDTPIARFVVTIGDDVDGSAVAKLSTSDDQLAALGSAQNEGNVE